MADLNFRIMKYLIRSVIHYLAADVMNVNSSYKFCSHFLTLI